MPRLEETWALARVRVRLMFRQSEMVFWVFAFPIVLSMVLGFAFRNAGAVPSPVGLLPGANADVLATTLGADPNLQVRRFDDEVAARSALRSGAIDVLVEEGTPPVLHLHPARPESETARLRVLAVLEGRPAGASGVARIVVVDEAGARYVDFLVPGLLGLNIYGTGLWSIGFGVADARQKKLLRRYLVTPMRRESYLASFMVFRLLFLALELVLLTAFGVWVMGVPLRGSLFAFGIVSVVAAICFAGVGLLSVCRVKTIEGASGMINVATIPVWLGSGVFFSYERFPEVIQPFLRLLPLTPLNDALRAIMLDGAGLFGVLPEIGIIAAWGVVSFALALRWFRWE